MANSSIPNSPPANGRTSRPSLRKLRRQRPNEFRNQESRKEPKSQGVTQVCGRRARLHFQSKSAFRVRVFSSWFPGFQIFLVRRVNGAWWRARSSKPLSIPHPRDRGRFDSYPLRLPFGNGESGNQEARKNLTIGGTRISTSWFPGFQIFPLTKGGDRQCRVSGSIS